MPSHTPPQERTNYFFKIAALGVIFWLIISFYSIVQGIICFIKNENPDEFDIIVIYINFYISFLLYLYIEIIIVKIIVLNEKPNEEEPNEEEPNEDLYAKALFIFLNTMAKSSHLFWNILIVYSLVQLIIFFIKNENFRNFYSFVLIINFYGTFFPYCIYLYVR